MLSQYAREAVEWTRELVKIPSVNPPGGEAEAAKFCAKVLTQAGLDASVDEFAPGRANVTAFAGNREDIGIVFFGHLDVVPATGEWTKPPFSGEIENGWLWGRGSSDMKSGCAAAMAAAKALLERGAPDKGICLCFVADEERVNLGAKRMRDTLDIKADACVVCEPTRLEVNYGHRGYASFFVRTHGVPCHAGSPENGSNAIYKMGRALEVLERYAHGLSRRRDPRLGAMSANVGVIRGGSALNIVPARCEIELEVRPFPGVGAQDIKDELRALLGDTAEVVIRSNLPGSIIDTDSPLVLDASRAVELVTGSPAVIGRFPACSEASFFSAGYNIPTILLGPGDLSVAHKPDEKVEVRQIEQAAEIYLGLMTGRAARHENDI